MVNTLQEYIEFTRTTAVYPKENELGYLVFGIFDELGEALEKINRLNYIEGGQYVPELISEISDIYWYTARLLDCLNVDLSLKNLLISEQDYLKKNPSFSKVENIPLYDKYTLQKKFTSLYKYLSTMCGNLKKMIRDNNDKKIEYAKNDLLQFTDALFYHTFRLAGANSPLHIMNVNVKKLSDRKERGVLKGDGDKR